MQEKTKCYWEQKNQQQVIVFLTHTIIYPCIDVMAVKYIDDINTSVSNRNQQKKALKLHPICLTESDHDYIVDKFLHRDKIEYEKNISVEDDE